MFLFADVERPSCPRVFSPTTMPSYTPARPTNKFRDLRFFSAYARTPFPSPNDPVVRLHRPAISRNPGNSVQTHRRV